MHKQFKPLIFSTPLLITAALFSMASINSHAVNVAGSLTAKTGYDSNPYRFNEQYSVVASEYQEYQARIKLKFSKKLSFMTKFNLQDYADSAEFADNQVIHASLKYQAGKFSKQRGISLNYKQKDKTYVSRLNGSTSTYNGQSLDDRYDYSQINLNAFRNFKLIKRVYNQLELDVNHKNYTDYPDLTITDFDYLGVKLTDTLAIRANKRNHHEIELAYESRFFTTREQKDAQGEEITGTEMAFNYLDLGYQYEYKPTKKTQFIMATGFTQRTDNGSGYYDSQKLALSFSAEQRWHKYSRIEASYGFSDFAYLREPEVSNISNEEEFTSEIKHELGLKSKTRLPKSWIKGASIILAYNYTLADSNRSQYQYERHTLNAGFKLAF